MTLTIYFFEFWIAFCFLASLEQLWEPPITASEQATIFLHSFPHSMVQQFCTDPDTQIDQSSLILDHIASRMDSILADEATNRPKRQKCRYVPPSHIPSADDNDFATDKREPILPMGPLPQRGFPLQPILLGGIPDCLALSCADPATFIPDLSDDNSDGTIKPTTTFAPTTPNPPNLTIGRTPT